MNTQEKQEEHVRSERNQPQAAGQTGEKLPVSYLPFWFLLAFLGVIAYGVLTK